MTIRRLRPWRRTTDQTTGQKASTTEEKAGAERLKEAGQIIAIFALMLVVLLGLVGIAVDVTYAWREELRVQRAADAAALAGVVYLPGNVSGGVSAAQAEGSKNGFGSVSAGQAAGNPANALPCARSWPKHSVLQRPLKDRSVTPGSMPAAS